ncbi:MAG: DUF2849 domain-containing protein [Alphaproteobacteria bacterium]
MARRMGDGPRVVTANRLRDGVVVYLTGSGEWTEDICGATATDDPDHQQRLAARAAADVSARVVVGPYAVPVAVEGSTPRPLSRRERIRAGGPTVGLGATLRGAIPGVGRRQDGHV